jgi:hypothetical protein
MKEGRKKEGRKEGRAGRESRTQLGLSSSLWV